MRNNLPLVVLGILFFLVFPMASAADTTLDSEGYAVTITTVQNGLLVTEEIEVRNAGLINVTEIETWIQQDAFDISLKVGDTKLAPTITGNSYTANLSLHELGIQPGESLTFEVIYTLPKKGENFYEKHLSYDSPSFSVVFNGDELYRLDNTIPTGAQIKLLLYRPTTAPLDFTVIMGVLMLVVILIASTLIILRKQRKKVKKAIVESEELLILKKALLMSALKDIEKKHRAEEISDDTYAKLKDEYKQQAVEVMKKLEDLK